MTRAARVRIDLSALSHNLQRVKQIAPDSRVLAMVKADAYGHGMIDVARALQEADGFGVAFVAEGLALRAAGIRSPIVVMQGFRDRQELDAAIAHRLDVTVHDPEQIALLKAGPLEGELGLWLKIDTGMHRMGVPAEEAPRVYQELRDLPSVAGPVTLMTHLACADDLDDSATPRQIQAFDKSVKGLEGPQSIANSAGILGWPGSHRDWVRPGIMLYGVSPLPGSNRRDHDLKPGMTLSAPLSAVKQLRRGDRIGYGATWTCPSDMTVGVVSIGYGDGYPRHAPSGTPVVVNGQRSRLLGRVSMDTITINLSGVDARRGDEVILWGGSLPAEEVAEQAGTIAYELFCAMRSCAHKV
ncbi:MAG: alanine racemase [Gammaproteobacteria bacterium]